MSRKRPADAEDDESADTRRSKSCRVEPTTLTDAEKPSIGDVNIGDADSGGNDNNVGGGNPGGGEMKTVVECIADGGGSDEDTEDSDDGADDVDEEDGEGDDYCDGGGGGGYEDVNSDGRVTPLDPLVQRRLEAAKVPTLRSLMRYGESPSATQASATLWCAALRMEVEAAAVRQSRGPAAAAEAWALLGPVLGCVAGERMVNASALRAHARAADKCWETDFRNCMDEPEIEGEVRCCDDNCYSSHIDDVQVSHNPAEALERLRAAADAEHRLRAIRASDAVAQLPAVVTAIVVSYTGFARSLAIAARGQIHDTAANADVALAEEKHDRVETCGLNCQRYHFEQPLEWSTATGDRQSSVRCVYRPLGYTDLPVVVSHGDGKYTEKQERARCATPGARRS